MGVARPGDHKIAVGVHCHRRPDLVVGGVAVDEEGVAEGRALGVETPGVDIGVDLGHSRDRVDHRIALGVGHRADIRPRDNEIAIGVRRHGGVTLIVLGELGGVGGALEDRDRPQVVARRSVRVEPPEIDAVLAVVDRREHDHVMPVGVRGDGAAVLAGKPGAGVRERIVIAGHRAVGIRIVRVLSRIRAGPGRVGLDRESVFVAAQAERGGACARDAVVVAVQRVAGADHGPCRRIEQCRAIGDQVANGQHVRAVLQGRGSKIDPVAVERDGGLILVRQRIQTEGHALDAADDYAVVAGDHPVVRIEHAVQTGGAADRGEGFVENNGQTRKTQIGVDNDCVAVR